MTTTQASISTPAPIQDRTEIVFFDVETTVPIRAIVEFGAILVCPRKLEELDNYETLVRPSDPFLISTLSRRRNGITPDAVVSAPTFSDIADKVIDILNGRIWAGHNILGFDCLRIREAFAEIGRPAPEPKGTIDSLTLLTQTFARRAGDMRMDSLANYFGLGQQTHRSLADARMNLEVVKYCATVLFLESSLPDIYTVNAGFVEPGEVSIPYIDAVPLFHGSPVQKIKLLHKGVPLQLCCSHLRIRFRISTKFVDPAGRPRLNFVVEVSPILGEVLHACDDVAKKLAVESGSSSDWQPVVTRKYDFLDYPTVKLNIPTEVNGDVAQYSTEIYEKEASGTIQELIFIGIDATELDALLKPGTFVDAFLSLDSYDYHQKAGIRLVAQKLIIHSGTGM